MKLVEQGPLSMADKIDVVFTELHREVQFILGSTKAGDNILDRLEAVFAAARLQVAEILDKGAADEIK